mgnify:CR=1
MIASGGLAGSSHSAVRSGGFDDIDWDEDGDDEIFGAQSRLNSG